MMKYMISGIDFIINEEGEAIFIEANSSPGAKLLKTKNFSEPLEVLARGVLDSVNEPKGAIVVRKTERDEGTNWKMEILSKFFSMRLCYFEDQTYNTPELIDINGKKFLPNVILYNIFGFAQLYKGDALQFNPKEVIRITLDKNLCMTIVKNLTKVKTPEEFMVFSDVTAKQIIKKKKELFDSGLVIKPLYGCGGKGVNVYENIPKELPKFRSARLIQNKIKMNLKEGKFWDVRTYVMNGKFCGAVSRISENPVVNLKRGGKFQTLDTDLMDVVKKPAEEIVKAINKVANCIDGFK